MKRVENHKHLGLNLYSKLKFKKNEKVSLIQIYMMQVWSDLDYCDIILTLSSNKIVSSLFLNLTIGILERTQYQTALANTGAYKGTNINKIYEELSWETLDMRGYFHQLVLFYKISNNSLYTLRTLSHKETVFIISLAVSHP